MNFNRFLLSIEHTLHALQHSYPYMPQALFLVAVLIIIGALYTKHDGARYASITAAVLIVVFCIVLI